MTKRVAWFTGQASHNVLTQNKVYAVFNEDGDSFNITDDKGGTRFCIKRGCSHICHGNWVLADVEVETEKQEILEENIATTKQPKWSEWIKNTTGKCPEGLKRKQKIKLKWSDGDKFNISKPHDAAWYFSKGAYPVDITHYKVKLKDVSEDTPKAQEKPKSKWTKNTGVRPVDGDVKVEIKTKDGDKECALAKHFSWGLCEAFCDIIKWRLAD